MLRHVLSGVTIALGSLADHSWPLPDAGAAAGWPKLLTSLLCHLAFAARPMSFASSALSTSTSTPYLYIQHLQDLQEISIAGLDNL